ncbi:hypothetical protein [Oceanobacillus indicireducens]|uniref:Uncharacterized protein n=1 Tax=Oceanobacillus indicireducens TaxID=1004261 RepID=A0A917Y2T8_9BACI|nr:hypothetical protein [Oceanobacillus indicireducens]GGN64539.1 hypothetical protein GCM10007971_32520 [Oceanobacillus indicireducens]
MAYIFLGNLTTMQLSERLGITLAEDEAEKLEEKRIDNAQVIQEGKWHCYDVPFAIHAGDYDTALLLAETLKAYEDDMKTSVQIAIKQ